MELLKQVLTFIICCYSIKSEVFLITIIIYRTRAFLSKFMHFANLFLELRDVLRSQEACYQ